MSTLKVNTLEEATSGGATFFTAKAWVNFNGTGTVAIRRDGNVSSLTDYGTGNYGVNLSNNLSAANYSVGGVAGFSATVGTRGDVNLEVPTDGVQVSQCRVLTTQAAFYDCNHVSVVCVE
jgi:hypothetical protein